MANWLTDYVRPRIRSLRRKTETPDNLWQTCDGCGQMIHHKEYKAALAVCPSCGFHHRIGPRDRFEQLFDEARYDLIDVPAASDDPLKFRDKKKYTDRLKDSRNNTGDHDALISAVGEIAGQTAVVGVQNFAFMAGSLGIGAGDAFLAGVRQALDRKAPYIIFTAAGGARMQEGILSLMQMPRTTVAVEMLRRAGLPYIVVLTDPTTGGVTASYAMLGDIAIAEPGALIGFAGQRVIEDTIREQLPEGFQRAEYLLDHGMIDMVVKRSDLREILGRLLRLLGEKGVLASHPPAGPSSKSSGKSSGGTSVVAT